MYLNLDLLYLIKNFYCYRYDFYTGHYRFQKSICDYCELEIICMDAPCNYYNSSICFPCIKRHFILNKLNFI